VNVGGGQQFCFAHPAADIMLAVEDDRGSPVQFELIGQNDVVRPAFGASVAVVWVEMLEYAEEESRLRKSAQGDKWSFCLMTGTLWPANQERS
jgi:hypothetical protein